MARHPFDPDFGQLPEEIPIFPLPGVLLLPGGRLPLNIFEKRYLAMVDDALSGNRIIGMVQPSHPFLVSPRPEVYPIGCAGRISGFAETDDGRYLITLTGLARFEIAREHPERRGYRVVMPDWQPYRGDLEEDTAADIAREKVLKLLALYMKHHNVEADWETINALSNEHLITAIAMMSPFEAGEKQALLEASDLTKRAEIATALLEMAVLNPGGQKTTRQ